MLEELSKRFELKTQMFSDLFLSTSFITFLVINETSIAWSCFFIIVFSFSCFFLSDKGE